MSDIRQPLKKIIATAQGVAYTGLATHWKCQFGYLIIIAENTDALAEVAQKMEPLKAHQVFDPGAVPGSGRFSNYRCGGGEMKADRNETWTEQVRASMGAENSGPMTPAQKRLAFPLRGPRLLTQAWWPVTVLAAAIDGYFEAFFMVLTPRGKP